MNPVARLRSLDSFQRHVVAASFLGWTLDAFDFFLLVMMLPTLARTFAVGVPAVAVAITLTLAMRPLGALIFGRLADRYGRRPVLMADIILFSVLAALAAASTSLAMLLVLRALFGIAMGGEWGLGAALTMESIPAEARGVVSGLLQEGYAFGYLLAAAAYFGLFAWIGWRGMFLLGLLPALLVLYVRRHVPESPVWRARRGPVSARPSGGWRKLAPRFLFLVLLMTAFNFFSHGSQDLYPTFLQQQRHFSVQQTGLLTMALNMGAILGGLFFGAASERIGRRRAIVIAALLALPAIPLWVWAPTPLLLGVGAFALQFMVQGAWGVVPAHINELSPDAVRGTLPGFAYQTGNLIAASTAPLLSLLALRAHGDYASVLALFVAGIALLVAVITALGPEARGTRFGADTRA
jgi:SHS family lactate transporter-like MFS transporter